MGGKALSKYGIFTERKSKEDFLRIFGKIQYILITEHGIFSKPIKSYHQKNDFGDIDILIKGDNISYKNIFDIINQSFKPNAINHNANVYSFDYENFQIDFIMVTNENWEIAETYFSYDPLGNCMGKVFHKFGLSYGWNGLYYKYRNFNGSLSNEILISKDPKKIFEFGGYDYNRYSLGFEKLEDIFEFVINSKYFNSKVFIFENLGHIDKKRNKKRVSYHKFLEYINSKDNINSFEFNKEKKDYLPIINNFFPEANLLDRINELDDKNKINRLISEKLNGKLIIEWTKISEGKTIGNLLYEFVKHFGLEYKNFILNSTNEEIHKEFMKFYENFKEK